MELKTSGDVKHRRQVLGDQRLCEVVAQEQPNIPPPVDASGEINPSG
jgi:hypothetical protein